MTDQEGLGPLLRSERRRRLIGADARCSGCGDAAAIPRRTQQGILCGSCHALLRTGHTTELQHVIGRANADLAVACDAALHDELSDRQRDWPPDTLRNPGSDPDLRRAAVLRSAADLIRVIAPLLEEHAEQLENPLAIPPLSSQPEGDRS